MSEQQKMCPCEGPAETMTVQTGEGPCTIVDRPVCGVDEQPPILRYFDFTPYREPLQQVAAEFASLAMYVADCLPSGSEQRVALRKLLEARDAALRAALDIPRGGMPFADDETPEQSTEPVGVPHPAEPSPEAVEELAAPLAPVEVFAGGGLVEAETVWPPAGETVQPVIPLNAVVSAERLCCQATQEHPGTVFIDPAPVVSAAPPQPAWQPVTGVQHLSQHVPQSADAQRA